MTPKHADGLNVCLTCFQGHCAATGDSHGHDKIHLTKSEHPIYMNIRMTEKPKEVDAEGKPAQTVTKLAIGKPGGIDAETDKYDTHARVGCLLCNKELPLTNP